MWVNAACCRWACAGRTVLLHQPGAVPPTWQVRRAGPQGRAAQQGGRPPRLVHYRLGLAATSSPRRASKPRALQVATVTAAFTHAVVSGATITTRRRAKSVSRRRTRTYPTTPPVWGPELSQGLVNARRAASSTAIAAGMVPCRHQHQQRLKRGAGTTTTPARRCPLLAGRQAVGV